MQVIIGLVREFIRIRMLLSCSKPPRHVDKKRTGWARLFGKACENPMSREISLQKEGSHDNSGGVSFL